MSRTAKTHIRQHGKEKLELLHDSTVPLIEQAKAFKLIRGNESNEKIAEIHYQESDGPLRVVRFITPAEKKARDEANARAQAESRRREDEQKKEAERIKAQKEKKLKAGEKANLDADKKAREEAKKGQ